MCAMYSDDVFDLEGEPGRGSSPPLPPGPASVASRSSAEETSPTVDGIELSRKAIEVEAEEAGVCPICLDDFVDDDPGMGTACG